MIERYQSSAFFAYYIYFNCLTILVMVFLVHLALRRVDTKVEEKKEEKKEVHSQRKTLLELVRNWKI